MLLFICNVSANNSKREATYRRGHVSPVRGGLLIHPLHGVQPLPRKIIVKINFTFIELRFKFHNYHRKYAQNVTHLYDLSVWQLNTKWS